MEMGRAIYWVSLARDNVHAISSPRYRPRVWETRYALSPTKDLVAELCATALPNVTTLTRDEMRLIGSPDSAPLTNVCAEISPVGNSSSFSDNRWDMRIVRAVRSFILSLFSPLG